LLRPSISIPLLKNITTQSTTQALNHSNHISQRVTEGDTTVYDDVLPIFAAMVTLQITHEIGHRLACSLQKEEVDLAPTLAVPSLQVSGG
jgi:hypothetical protein